MFISDGLGPSIFCRKMEATHRKREEMDEKCLFPAIAGIHTLILHFIRVPFPICALTLLCFPTRKGKSRRNGSETDRLSVFIIES